MTAARDELTKRTGAQITELEKEVADQAAHVESQNTMIDDLQRQNAQWEVRHESAVTEKKRAVEGYEDQIKTIKREQLVELKKLTDSHNLEMIELRDQLAKKEDELKDSEESNEFMNIQLASEMEKGRRIKDEAQARYDAECGDLKRRLKDLELREQDLSKRLRDAERIAREKEDEAAKAIKKGEADKKAKEQLQKSLDTAIRMLKNPSGGEAKK
ncbi:MAG: hypothetical protein WC889_04775 [Myxococcota bacterium]